MPRSRLLAGMVVLLLVAGGLRAAEVLRVTTLTREGRLLVSFELAGAFNGEMRDTIRSGLQTTFSYDVRLRQEAAFWPDNTVASATLEATVRYDNLTEQFNVARSLDGRVEETTILANESEVRDMLTRFERVPLFSTAALEPNGAYHVQVDCDTRPRNAWFVWPWERASASGAARFTFLP